MRTEYLDKGRPYQYINIQTASGKKLALNLRMITLKLIECSLGCVSLARHEEIPALIPRISQIGCRTHASKPALGIGKSSAIQGYKILPQVSK